MKLLSLTLLLCLALACQQSPKSEATNTAASNAATVDSTKGVVNFAGPGTELLKKVITAFAAGDWATYRACFADSAVTFHNTWVSNTGGVSLDSITAILKADRDANWESIEIVGSPIIETVVGADGTEYGHVWMNLAGKSKQNGKTWTAPVFVSSQIKDGKLQWEWPIYNNAVFEAGRKK